MGTSFVFDMSSPDIEIYWAQHVTGWEFLLIGDSLDFLGQVHNRTSGDEAREACLRIVDVRGIMGRACAKQWGAHVQSNGLRMCKAMACAWRWLYLLANTSAPLKDQSSMLSLSCMDMVSPDKLSRLLLSMKPVQLNNLSASVLVAKTQRYFLASLHRLGNCGLLGLNQSKGSSPSSRAFSERSCLLLLC